MFTRRRFLSSSASLYGALAGYSVFANESAITKSVVLTAEPARAPLIDTDKPTSVWGYNSQVPGPVVRVRQSGEVRVKLRNRLPIATTIHWHGIRIVNAMDGVGNLTQPPVSPGSDFDYAFVAPDAGTFWYHPHYRSAEAVARGLYGLLIVDEPDPPIVDRDLPLALDDWRLDDAGEIDTASFGNLHDASHQGRLGNVLSVNGLPAPEVAVAHGERLRLRLANTANSRVMTLDFGTLDPQLIALDGQPATASQLPDKRLILAPGQRADVIVDIDLEPTQSTELTVVTRGGTTPAVRFVAGKQRLREQPLDAPVGLPANPLERRLELDSALNVDLLMLGGAMGRMRSARHGGKELSMRELASNGLVWAFNGNVGMPESPLFSATLGQTLRLNMINDTRWPHAMHFHGHHGRVLNAGRREAADLWRDTVLVDPGERLDVAFVADNPGHWMLHCHMLEHQAAGMATWFAVS